MAVFKKYWDIAKETFKEFMDENVFSLSASIAFYTIFSLPGVLIIVIHIAGAVFGKEMVQGELSQRMEDTLGSGPASEIQSIIEQANIGQGSILTVTIGVIVLIFSATTVFTIIQQVLNQIWSVKAKPKKGWVKYVRDRILSFVMIVILGMLMMLTLLLDFSVVLFRKFIDKILPVDFSFFLPLAGSLVSFLIMLLVFTLIFKILPDAKIQWKDVSVGAFVTTVLFTAGKYLIGLYLSLSSFSSTYGAAGSIVLILLWVNYSSVIMLMGAEFTQVYTRYSGRKIHPSSNAVKIAVKEIELEG
jgi:membrane protein